MYDRSVQVTAVSAALERALEYTEDALFERNLSFANPGQTILLGGSYRASVASDGVRVTLTVTADPESDPQGFSELVTSTDAGMS